MSDPVPDFDDWIRARGADLLRFRYLITRDRTRAEEAVQVLGTTEEVSRS